MFENKNIIDISLPLTNSTVVYPGNVPLEIENHAKMPDDSSHLSKITMGTHTGTHIDAPLHAIIGGKTLDEISFDNLIGRCLVIDVTHREFGEAVEIEDLGEYEAKKGDRILFKTKNSERGFSEFYDDYVYVSGDLADHLGAKNVGLVGIDYLSIKQRGSSDHRPHTSILEKNIPIIEGIDLSIVEHGDYHLVCLPLKFIDVEGGPARAILIKQ
jgi:arylformamidase